MTHSTGQSPHLSRTANAAFLRCLPPYNVIIPFEATEITQPAAALSFGERYKYKIIFMQDDRNELPEAMVC